METKRLQEFVEQISQATPRADAYIRIGGDDDEIELIGNNAGLLRLAAELLTATYTDANPSYLFERKTSAPFPAIIKNIVLETTPPEPLAPKSPMSRWRDRLAKAGCLVIIGLAAVCAIIGFWVLLKAL
jgi:hypothetical protein